MRERERGKRRRRWKMRGIEKFEQLLYLRCLQHHYQRKIRCNDHISPEYLSVVRGGRSPCGYSRRGLRDFSGLVGETRAEESKQAGCSYKARSASKIRVCFKFIPQDILFKSCRKKPRSVISAHKSWLRNVNLLKKREVDKHAYLIIGLSPNQTPFDIASRSGSSTAIIGLLSITPEEAESLGWKGMLR